jgi:predicted ABC-type ATPase
MTELAPSVVVLSGPNGAGKSTAAPAVLRDGLGGLEFVAAGAGTEVLVTAAPETWEPIKARYAT